MLNVINAISAKDRAIGWMALQIHQSANGRKWYVAIASLFMLTEQVLRWAAESDKKETLDQIIDRALKEKLILENDARILHTMRDYRNGYLHADFHGFAFVINEMVYPVNDEETAEHIYSVLSAPCFQVIHKLVTST